MYNQRRGLAPASLATDQEARATNMQLIQGKRRQLLEAQLAEKLELYKQYTNPRGIGMRGQTVAPRDVEILEQQINTIRAQLEGRVPETPQQANTPMSQPAPLQQQVVGTPSYGGGYPPSSGQQQSYPSQRVAEVQQLPFAAQQLPLPSAPSSTTSTGSRREQVWQMKYEQWLRRQRQPGNGSSNAPPPMGYMMQAQQPSMFDAMPSSRSSNVSHGFTPPASVSQGVNPYVPQQQPLAWNSQQPSQAQPIAYGRRATPPNGSQHPLGGGAQQQQQQAFPQQQQQQQQQQAFPQQQQGIPRRGQQQSSRPW